MDRFDDDILFAELRALRPTPRPQFAAELDERAAAGFPRRQAPSEAAMPFALLADRWRAMSPRRRLMPALAVALAALVVATAVVAISQTNSGTGAAEDASLGMVAGGKSSGASESAAAGESAEAQPSYPSRAHHGGPAGHGHKSAGHSSNETVYEPEVPSVEAIFEAEGAPKVEKAGALAAGHRDIERSAYVILGTKPGEVSSAATKVFEAVHAAHGIVLHSRVQSGSAGATGAYFELLIPGGKLDDALASFSQVAEVRERHDATNDITAPTVGATEELRDSNAAIEGLLKELGDVETEAERESVEARLREERRRHAAIRASLDHLDKRASMSEVTVRIVTDHGAGVTPAPPSSGNWGVGDALHDAGQILTIAAGVLLIALAVLTPIGLVALALWLANRFRVRRLRERTLG
ncbi:MAG TPA: DUF4349 domain-containing protein [Solirubrobacterales bacterium]|jgi:hypothetical protein